MIRRSTVALIVFAMAGLPGLAGVALQAQSPKAQPSQVSEPQAKTLNLSAYAELLRSDVQAQKIAILTQVMGFTEAEDTAFWPIYRDYNAEMAKLGDERVALIEEYANAYSKITDTAAQSIASRAIDLQKRRNAALEACYGRVAKAMSPKTALRFLQVEHQLLLIIDLQISAALPIVQ